MTPIVVALALTLAAPWYVDGDARCPGDGSDGAPFCTVQRAFDNPALAAGDEIRLRTAALPYAGARIGDADGTAPVSGTAAAPIVLRPDDGHGPVVAGTIAVLNASHWTIRDLVFHGEGDASPTRAIDVFSDGSEGDVVGIVVERNTVLGFGGAPELDEGPYASAGVISVGSWTPDGTPVLVAPIIRDNHVRQSRGAGIHVALAADALVEGNEISALDCQLDYSYLDEGTMAYVTRAAVMGMRVRDSPRPHLVGNRIEALDVAGCAVFDVDTHGVYGILVDDSILAEIDHNLIRDIGLAPVEGMGINIAQGTDDARVHHNIIAFADRCGLCNGLASPGGGNRTRYVSNTIVGGSEHGIDVMEGDAAFIGNNLVSGTADAAIRILAVEGWATGWSADDNLYWDGGTGEDIGQIGWTVETDLATWQSDCGCDADSLVADPILPGSPAAEDFTVATTSPAIDAGAELDEVGAWNGAGPDIGALEAPLAREAAIAVDEPDTIRLQIEHNGTGELTVDPSCLGLAVLVDGEVATLVGCTVLGTEIAIVLAEPVWAGQSVVLVHTGGTITDGARIGGLVSAFLRPFELTVDNAAQGEPPADGSSTSDAPPSTDTTAASSDTGTGAAQTPGSGFPDASACECSSGASHPRAWPWLLALATVRRRRRERAA